MQLVNTTMDGISMEANRIAVIANCKASSGAWIDYDSTGDQASYFKCTRTGSHAFYCMNDTCLDGAIGIHYSTPTSQQALQDSTLGVFTNCYLNNQYSGSIHMEDCHRVFLYNCNISGDAVEGYKLPAHFSNQTVVASIKNCTFKNIQVNFNQASNLKLGLIDGCTFITETPKINTFINGHPHLSTNNSFSGACASQQAEVINVRNCTFKDFKNLAVSSAYATDGSTFINGSTPVSTRRGGFVVNCIYQKVKNPINQIMPSNSDWKKVFSSYIDVYNDGRKYLGRISCGSDILTNTQTSVASITADAFGSTDAKRHATGITYSFDSLRHTSVPGITSAEALSNSKMGLQSQEIKLYPNPTTDILHVNLNDKIWGKTMLNIYDQQGRLVQSKAVDKNSAVLSETINVSSLPAGAYILNIINEHQQSALRFIVAR